MSTALDLLGHGPSPSLPDPTGLEKSPVRREDSLGHSAVSRLFLFLFLNDAHDSDWLFGTISVVSCYI